MFSRRLFNNFLVCFIALGSTGYLFAQQPGNQPRKGGVTTRQRTQVEASTTIRRSSVMVGASVTLQDGYRLGRVEEFVIDDGGCIDFIVVSYGQRFVAIPWVAAEFSFDQRVFSLRIERSQLAQIPTFTDFRVLAQAESRQKIATFFGVEGTSHARPGAKAENGKTEPGTKPQPGEKTQPGTEPETRPRPGTQPKQPGAKPQPGTETQPGTEPRPGAKPRPGTQPEQPGTKPRTQPGTKPQPKEGGAPESPKKPDA
jgi:hypothetical protein